MKSSPHSERGRSVSTKLVLAAGAAFAAFGAGSATADDAAGAEAAVQGRTIGYVMTQKLWSIYKTEGEPECPSGYNDGPREQFTKLFPDDGAKRTLLETQLAREAEVWFPTTSEEPYPFLEAQGNIARGLNLDGKVDPDDYTSPEGETGIDNQFHRALRCVAGYGTPDSYMTFFENRVMHDDIYGRVLIELTEVDSIENDDEVIVTTYRGLDGLLLDAAGQNFLPYSTQRVDGRWGDQFVQTFTGKIVDGVLTTEPADLEIPWPVAFSQSGVHVIRDLRFRLDLTPEDAKGLMAGYTDVEAFYLHSNTGWSTHHQSYGQLSQPSLYRALRRLADGHPDPETGENTAISSAIEVEFKQAYIVHPQQQSAAGAADSERNFASTAAQ